MFNVILTAQGKKARFPVALVNARGQAVPSFEITKVRSSDNTVAVPGPFDGGKDGRQAWVEVVAVASGTPPSTPTEIAVVAKIPGEAAVYTGRVAIVSVNAQAEVPLGVVPGYGKTDVEYLP